MCSPRGSLDQGLPPDSGSSIGLNSVEITSPRLHSKSIDVEMDAIKEMEQNHKITQTDYISNIDDVDDEINADIKIGEDEVLIDKTEKNKKKSKNSKSHRILINLDDKNRFTDEITV